MSLTLNFDKFMSENKREEIDVTVFGKVYKVPAAVPAIVPVMMARAELAGDAQESTKMIMRAADIMFGGDAVDEMCRNGMSAPDLAGLVQMLFAKINGQDPDEDEAEELTDEDSRKAAPGGKSEKK